MPPTHSTLIKPSLFVRLPHGISSRSLSFLLYCLLRLASVSRHPVHPSVCISCYPSRHSHVEYNPSCWPRGECAIHMSLLLCCFLHCIAFPHFIASRFSILPSPSHAPSAAMPMVLMDAVHASGGGMIDHFMYSPVSRPFFYIDSSETFNTDKLH